MLGGAGDDGLTDASTRLNSHRTVMAEIKVSDLFLPLEQRLQARIDALEGELQRRCGALEAKVSVLVDTAAGGMQQRHAHSDVGDLADKVCQCNDKQSALQGNIDELWRQLKADRRESLSKFCTLSDTIELHLQSLVQRVSKSCGDITGILTDELKQPIHEAVGACARTGIDGEVDLHASEEEDRLPTLLGSQKTTVSEHCSDDPIGGIQRRHTAVARSTSMLQAPAPQFIRSPPQSPGQLHRTPEAPSPRTGRAASPRKQGCLRRQQANDGRAVGVAQPSAVPTCAGTGPVVNVSVRRVTSAPFSASAYVSAQRNRSDGLRSQVLRGAPPRSQRDQLQSPILGGGGTQSPTSSFRG